MKLLLKLSVVFLFIALSIWVFKFIDRTLEAEYDCSGYIFSETKNPDTYFLFDKEFSTKPKTFLRPQNAAKKTKTPCAVIERHFAFLENWGPDFQGALLTGPAQSYSLIETNLVYEDWGKHIAFYEKYAPSPAFGLYRNSIEQLSNSPENHTNNKVFCRDITALYSLTSSMEEDEDIGVFKSLITAMIANCDGVLRFSFKSETDPNINIEDVNLLYKEAYSYYFGGHIDESVQEHIEGLFDSKLKTSIKRKCPKKFEITSKKGLCYHFE